MVDSPGFYASGITLYDVLGAAPTASAAELRRAYLAKARTLHPDQSGDTAGMQELNAAWEVLGDPRARAAYDRQLRPTTSPAVSADAAPREREPWEDEDERIQADIERRMAEPFDLVSAFLRSLPVLIVLFVLFVIVIFTAYAGGGGDNEIDVPRNVPGPSTPAR